MTTPNGGGKGGDINLATMWVPVAAETSHFIQGVRDATKQAREEIITGLGGSTFGVGDQLAAEITSGLKRGFAGIDMAGISTVSSGLIRGFEGLTSRTEAANRALLDYHKSHDQLLSAMERESVAQSRLNDLHTKGVTEGTQLLSAQNSLESAHRRVATAAEEQAQAHEHLQTSVNSSKNSMLGFAVETGVVSGAISGGMMLAAAAVEGFGSAAKRIFDGVVEGAVDVGKEVFRIGEDFQQLNRELITYTNAQGQALADLQNLATSVYRNLLDTDTKELGQTIGVLRSQFADLATDTQPANSALESLTHDLLEVGDRMGKINVRQFSAAMHEFGVDGQDAGRMLAVMTGDAQAFGVTIQGLIQDMITAGPTLSELGVNSDAAAQGLSKMEQQGINANKTVLALSAAAKEAGKEGNSGDFKQFIQNTMDAIKFYQEHGRTGDALDLATTIFGTRNATQAMKAGQDLLDMLNNVVDASGRMHTPEELNKWEEATETLDNKWHGFINDFEASMKPLGALVIGGLTGGLEHVKDWFDQHQPEIIDKIKGFGDTFIKALPTVKVFAEDFLDILEYVGIGIQAWVSNSMEALGLLVGGLGKILEHVPGMGSLGHDLDDIGKGLVKGGKALSDADIAGTIEGIKKKVDDLDASAPGLTDHWDDLTHKWKDGAAAAKDQQDALTSLNDVVNQQFDQMVAPTSGGGAHPSAYTNGGQANIQPAAAYSGGSVQNWLGSALISQGLSPDEARGIMAMNSVEGGASNPQSLLGFTESQAQGPQGHLQAFMGQWNDTSRRGPGGQIPGVASDGSVVDWHAYMTWIREKIVGQNGSPSDWQGNAQPAPQDYQNRLMTALGQTPSPSGLPSADGGSGASGGSPSGPIVNMPGSDYGASAGHPTIAPPDENTIRSWVQQQFGIPNSFGTGSWENRAHEDDHLWHHPGPGMSSFGPTLPTGGKQFGYAFDFHGSDDQMSALANWVANNYSKETLELIYGGAGFDQNREISNTKPHNMGAGLNAAHRDHVHWAMTAPPYGMDDGGSGANAFTAGFHTVGHGDDDGGGDGNYPGRTKKPRTTTGGQPPPSPPAGPGVSGVDPADGGGYWISAPGFDTRIFVRPGENPSQAMERERQTQQSQRTLDNDAANIPKLTQAEQDAQTKFHDLDTQKNTAAPQDPRWQPGGELYNKWDEAQQKLTNATDALTRAREKQAGDTQEQTIATQKQFEDQTKQPKGHAGAGGPSEDLGRGFLKGIFDSLGLGNVLGGKSPLEWGSVKMGLGALNWGIGVMNSMGLNNAAANPSAFSGVSPTASAGDSGGIPLPSVHAPGAAPGPPVAGAPAAPPPGGAPGPTPTAPAPGTAPAPPPGGRALLPPSSGGGRAPLPNFHPAPSTIPRGAYTGGFIGYATGGDVDKRYIEKADPKHPGWAGAIKQGTIPSDKQAQRDTHTGMFNPKIPGSLGDLNWPRTGQFNPKIKIDTSTSLPEDLMGGGGRFAHGGMVGYDNGGAVGTADTPPSISPWDVGGHPPLGPPSAVPTRHPASGMPSWMKTTTDYINTAMTLIPSPTRTIKSLFELHGSSNQNEERKQENLRRIKSTHPDPYKGNRGFHAAGGVVGYDTGGSIEAGSLGDLLGATTPPPAAASPHPAPYASAVTTQSPGHRYSPPPTHPTSTVDSVLNSWLGQPKAGQSTAGVVSHGLNRLSFGIIPDAVQDVNTFTNWGKATPGEHWQAGIDAGIATLPGIGMAGRSVGRGVAGLGRGVWRGATAVGDWSAGIEDRIAAVESARSGTPRNTPLGEHSLNADEQSMWNVYRNLGGGERNKSFQDFVNNMYGFYNPERLTSAVPGEQPLDMLDPRFFGARGRRGEDSMPWLNAKFEPGAPPTTDLNYPQGITGLRYPHGSDPPDYIPGDEFGEKEWNFTLGWLRNNYGPKQSGPQSPLRNYRGGPIRGYAAGSWVTGGAGGVDDIPAMLNAGDFVVNKNSAVRYGSQLESLGFAQGGQVPVMLTGGEYVVPGAIASQYHAELEAINQSGLRGYADGGSISGTPDVMPVGHIPLWQLGSQSSGAGSLFGGLGDTLTKLSKQAITNGGDSNQHIDNSIHIQGNTIADPKGLQQSIQERQNSRFYTVSGGLPRPSVGAP